MNNYLFTFNAQQLSQQLQPYSDSTKKKTTRPQSTKPNLALLKEKRKVQHINQLFETGNLKNRQKCKTSHISRKYPNIKMLQSIKKNIQYEIPNLEHLRLAKKEGSSKQNQMNFGNINTKTQQCRKIEKPMQPSQSQQLYYPASKRQSLFGIQLQIFNGGYQNKQPPVKKMSVGRISDQNQKKVKFGVSTPKILYPQSDRKLPSVFKIRSVKQSPSSIRNRVNSSKTIAQSSQKQQIFQDSLRMDPLIRTKFRPQSMMISTSKKQGLRQSIRIPKKLVFDYVEDNLFSQILNKRVGQKDRNKSSHQYRRLKELPTCEIVQSGENQYQKSTKQIVQIANLKKSSKQDSKQHFSTTQTIQTPNPKIKLRQKSKFDQKKQQKKFDLTCSITFQLDKKQSQK